MKYDSLDFWIVDQSGSSSQVAADLEIPTESGVAVGVCRFLAVDKFSPRGPSYPWVRRRFVVVAVISDPAQTQKSPLGALLSDFVVSLAESEITIGRG